MIIRRNELFLQTRGFAIVLTLVLLSLLVVIALAISSVSRISSNLSDAKTYQVQAQQNALLGLRVALGQLQKTAGPDARITGMAGVTGIPRGKTNSTRHWCGVWTSTGGFLQWLVSGANTSGSASIRNNITSIELFGKNSMGSEAADSERIIAGKIPIVKDGISLEHYAFTITDEGVKIPVYVPTPILAVSPQLFSRYATDDPDEKEDIRGKLRDAIASNISLLPSLISYEQLALLDSSVTLSVLQDNLHHVSLDPQFVEPPVLIRGKVNVNTNSKRVWQGLLQTYDLQPSASVKILSDQIRLRGEDLGEYVHEYTNGSTKLANSPFTNIESLEEFFLSEFPADKDPPTGTDIMDVLRPMLTLRSDTFRLRSYGDAMNPADAGVTGATPESVAYCEAIVQRTTEPDPSGNGKRFVITYFRWLGPDDI